MKSFSWFWETAKIVIIAVAIVAPIRAFVFQPFLVRGDSMVPNFHNGDYLIIDELSYRFRNPERGEVVVFRFPLDESHRYIKRIVGLPGETVEVTDGSVIVVQNDQPVPLQESYLPVGVDTKGQIKLTLKENEYFVLGDNRTFSSDSRAWGVLPEEDIIGRVLVRVFPLSAFAKMEVPVY